MDTSSRDCWFSASFGRPPIDSSDDYFLPQNNASSAALPTDLDWSRYATVFNFDYQKDAPGTVEGDTVLLAQLGNLNATQIGQLITFVDTQMKATDGTGGLPNGFQMTLQDINGDGTGSNRSAGANHLGSLVQVVYPTINQLIPTTGGSPPWQWVAQARNEVYTSNLKGQFTTHTNAEGNLTVYVRYPENNPDGDGDVTTTVTSSQQYGRVKEVHVDVYPNYSAVMSLVGASGDMVSFSQVISRNNSPGVYLNLITGHQGSSGCTTCNYDPMGNVLTTVDTRLNTTTYMRNEMGQVYQVIPPAPYAAYVVETSYDANGNTIQVDTRDIVVDYETSDTTSPDFAMFAPTGSGTTANLPTIAGQGGVTRTGQWFSNVYTYDLLDNKIEDDIDASYAGMTTPTGVALITNYKYDANNNLIQATKPLLNIVQYDYDERNLRIAQQLGYNASAGQPGAVTVWVYDGNGNMTDMVGPVNRTGTTAQISVTIHDPFMNSGPSSVTYAGDWVAMNTYDGFDRVIEAVNAAGGTTFTTFDPGSRVIEVQMQGTPPGYATPNHSTATNVILSDMFAYFDEAGRAYDNQQMVFLNTGINSSTGTVTHTLASTRSVTFTGGGLAVNNTSNGNITPTTLTTGGQGYVLSRTVYDKLGRTTLTAADNTAQTKYTYDGADRQLTVTDALLNVTTNSYDANGNVVGITRSELGDRHEKEGRVGGENRTTRRVERYPIPPAAAPKILSAHLDPFFSFACLADSRNR